ncbi:MAG: penicillin-binding protein activator, partial [Pseudomonadota bacterium]
AVVGARGDVQSSLGRLKASLIGALPLVFWRRLFMALLGAALVAACGTTGPRVSNVGLAPQPVVSSTLEIPRPPRPAVDQFGRSISPNAVRVGILLPLSGPSANLGDALLNAAELALFQAAGPNFELIPVDTGGTAGGAARAAQEAINQGSELLLGPLFSDSVRPAAEVAERYGVNVVAFTTDATVAGNNVYVMGLLPSQQVERVVAYGVQRGISRYAVLAPNTPYGNLVASTMAEIAPRYGATVNVRRSYPEQSQNYSTEVESLAASAGSFDAIMLPDFGLRLRQVAPLIPYYGMRDAQIVGTGVWDGAGVNIEPAMVGAWYAAPPPGLRSGFEAQYESRFGAPPIRLLSVAYDSVALAALLSQGATPGTARFDSISLTDPEGFVGLDGVFRFSADGLSERGLAVLEVTEEEPAIIDPAPTSFGGFGT